MYKRGNKWRAQYIDANGQRQSATFKLKKDAAEFEEKHNRQKVRQLVGLSSRDDTVTFIDYCRTWLIRMEGEVVLSTWQSYERRLRNYWLPRLGNRRLATISTSEIREHMNQIQADGKSASERDHHRAVMHKLFKDAFMDELVDVNPVARIKLLNQHPDSDNFLDSEDEIQAVIDAAYSEHHRYGVLYEILFYAGLRIGEAIPLKFHDIQVENKVLRLNKIYDRSHREIVNYVKGKAKKKIKQRFTILPPRVIAAVFEWRKIAKFVKDTDFVLHNDEGKYIVYDTLKEVHKRVMKASEIEKKLTLHGCRHTFGTLCDKYGFQGRALQKSMGHSSFQTTERYLHRDQSLITNELEKTGFGMLKKHAVKK